MRELNPKQQAFVEHYLTCWNATEAARRAGYSAHTANEQGSRLLANVSVRASVEKRMSELAMSADEVLTRLADHARGSIADMLNDEDELDLNAARAAGKLHLVKKVKQTTRIDPEGNRTTTFELELHDPQAALVHLGRHHKLFTDRIEVRGWREEAIEAGVDPDGLVNDLFAKVRADAGNAA